LVKCREYDEHQCGRIDLPIDNNLKQSAIRRAKKLESGVGDIAELKVPYTGGMNGIE
jgi:hypothetical protein